MDLFVNAIVAGILLGAFYAAVAIGLSITFGQLDIVNIAHPAFVVVGSYIAWILNSSFGFDPILVGILAAPVFFFVGALIYRVYYAAFERTGQESLSGLAFFFGVMFIIEVVLILVYGVDYRLVGTDYIGENIDIGFVGLPLRLVVPFFVASAMTAVVRPMSSASAPISRPSTVSPISSPALRPTMPAPSRRLVLASKINLVKPSSRPIPSARPDAAQGNTPFSISMPWALASVSVRPIQATSGSV
jgi:hypothetical protein